MMEKVIVAKSRTVDPEKTKICCTRYGNVMCSRGSVIPLWIEQIKAGNPITITEPSMTRFIMSLEEAVDLVLFAFENGTSGDILVQKAPACTIEVLAKAVTELFAPGHEIKVIGIRHGEKMYETLLVDIISDVNMAYSEHARRYLADCGLPKERTYVTGSPMAEVLHDNLEKIEASDVHARLGLEKGKYILLSAHREENIDTEKNFLSLFEAINKIAEKYDMPILYSCHPRSRKRLEASGFQLDKRVIQHEPLGFHDYNCLQMNAFAVVSDSGTLPEESSFFTSVGHPFPAVCIRTSTERPEALDKGCFVLAGIDSNSLVQAVETAVAMNENGDYGIPVPDYVEENVSTKVVKIIQSYTGVVNKMVWRKF